MKNYIDMLIFHNEPKVRLAIFVPGTSQSSLDATIEIACANFYCAIPRTKNVLGMEDCMNILEEIVEKKRIAVDKRRSELSFEQLKNLAEQLADKELQEKGEYTFPFKRALSKTGVNFICEVKKASPSKGLIAKDFPYLDIAREYEAAGAAAVSVLTEEEYFLGRDEYLKEIAENIKIPVLRKDFIIDEYQIYEAKVLGAKAVLLICAILSGEQLKKYLAIAHSLGLSALVEAHDEAEVLKALEAGAGIIGVNNRDLKTFKVDINNSVRLRSRVSKDIIFISESGIKSAEDIKILRENGVNGVLIGEQLMRCGDKKAELERLKGDI